jgi:outer membrane protein assembly factor BamA
VGDDTRWGPTGPVSGGRYDLAFRPSFRWLPRGLCYRTVTLDARRYWNLPRGYTVAARVLGGRSDARDAQTFFVGGASMLRGFSRCEITGTRMAIVNAELRFPFIERFGMVGPVPLGGRDLRGALFADAGCVWRRGEPLRFTRVERGGRRLASPLASFGAGVRAHVGFVILKLDAAWQTDLASVSRPRWEFSSGPEF